MVDKHLLCIQIQIYTLDTRYYLICVLAICALNKLGVSWGTMKEHPDHLSYYALSISSSYFCHHYNLALLLRSNLRSRMYIFCIKCKIKGKLVYLAEIYWSFTVLGIDRRYCIKLLIILNSRQICRWHFATAVLMEFGF